MKDSLNKLHPKYQPPTTATSWRNRRPGSSLRKATTARRIGLIKPNAKSPRPTNPVEARMCNRRLWAVLTAGRPQTSSMPSLDATW